MPQFTVEMPEWLRQGIPEEVYELIALGARYWFLFLMALIVWRSYRWYRKDKRSWRKRLRELPDAGLIGEFLVEDGSGVLENGTLFSVPREGTIGRGATNDICLKDPGIRRNQLWFRYEEGKGLLVRPFGRESFRVDGVKILPGREEIFLGHGSLLEVGVFVLRLRMFEGFDCPEAFQVPAGMYPVEMPVPAADEEPAFMESAYEEESGREAYQTPAQIPFGPSMPDSVDGPVFEDDPFFDDGGWKGGGQA